MSRLPAVLAAVAALVVIAPGRPPARRLCRWLDGERRHGRAPGRSPAPDTVLARLGRPVARGLGVVGRVGRAACGRPAHADRDRRLGAALVAGALVLPVAPLLALPLAGAVYGGPVLRARSLEARRRARLAAAAPDLVELFRLAVGAGLTVGQAVSAVTARAPRAWGGPLDAVADRVAVGHRLADALEGLGAADESVRPLSAALVAAERYGVPLGVTLERLAHDARQQRRRRAEEVARRLPVQLLFPLVLCVLPAFALLTVVPLVATAVGGLPPLTRLDVPTSDLPPHPDPSRAVADRSCRRKANPMSLSSRCSPMSSSLPSSTPSSSSSSRSTSPCACPRPSRSLGPRRPRPSHRSGARDDRGQTTAEYALVLLGAATIAMLVVTWAGSSGAIGSLFDAVVSHVIGAVK